MKSQLELLFSSLNSNVEKTELFIALSKSRTPGVFSYCLGAPVGFMVFVEVAAGGSGLVTGEDGEDAVVEGLQTATRMRASEPVLTAMEEEVTQVAMSAIQAIRSRNLLGTIY